LLEQLGFQVLVLCAKELQPSASAYPGILVLHAPNDDRHVEHEPPTHQEIEIALRASCEVRRLLSLGKRVLVTCAQGRNRSGLVSGLVLVTNGLSADEAVSLIRSKRRNALSNTHFVRCLQRAERARQRVVGGHTARLAE
jgi:protein-tyrosine phosphatase